VSEPDAGAAHWDRSGLAARVRAALDEAGLDLTALTVDDLAALDQFHGGGLALTRRLARLAAFTPGMRVLDVGGGLGGPARTIAVEYGCAVTVVDLARSYVDAGRMLTSLMHLEDRVGHVVGDALDLPFDDGAFDAVWTQNSGMNIADKERQYAESRRVVRTGGRLVTQEPMLGPGGPPYFPTMWAPDPSGSHLREPASMRAAMESAGFRTLTWDVVTVDRTGPSGPPRTRTIQELVMGADRLAAITAASRRTEAEGRLAMIQAVLEAATPASDRAESTRGGAVG
jgi:SAM-dependent methyltransferase